MEWIINQLRVHPELAIFLTLFAGFWLGRLKIGKFSLGTVTSVLLVGVLVGQLNITVDGPMKAVFFLLFLFAVGYKVGPQFFRGLKKDGLPQVGFAVLMCIVSLVAPWILAKIMGYHMGEAAGLLAGSQTISAVIGVASDTINQLGISDAQKATYINAIPVAYAVTYIFGTAGSAWILASLGPKMLGGQVVRQRKKSQRTGNLSERKRQTFICGAGSPARSCEGSQCRHDSSCRRRSRTKRTTGIRYR